MRPSVVLDSKRIAVRAAVERFPTSNPRVFGSVLYGTVRIKKAVILILNPAVILSSRADLADTKAAGGG
jgi:hypothetical protein